MLPVLLLSLLWLWHGQDKHVVHWAAQRLIPLVPRARLLSAARHAKSQANSKASHSRLNLVQSKRKLLKGSHLSLWPGLCHLCTHAVLNLTQVRRLTLLAPESSPVPWVGSDTGAVKHQQHRGVRAQSLCVRLGQTAPKHHANTWLYEVPCLPWSAFSSCCSSRLFPRNKCPCFSRV